MKQILATIALTVSILVPSLFVMSCATVSPETVRIVLMK